MSDSVKKSVTLDDLVDREARQLATDLIERELYKQNLPLPKESALAIHVDAILKSQPNIRENAEKRVKARKDAYTESLRKIGINVQVVNTVVDIEL